MAYSQLDRRQLRFRSLQERPNKVMIERDQIVQDAAILPLDAIIQQQIEKTAAQIVEARHQGRPVILAFGAHTIKNGLAPVLIALLEKGWITHLATNGAGIIHDWEFAYQGQSSEDVRVNVAQGQFGLWEETGRYLNLALLVGAYQGRGYGESVGAMIHQQGLDIPNLVDLRQELIQMLDTVPEKAAAAADLLASMRNFDVPAGWLEVAHPYARFSVQAAAYRLGVPFTGHPMIGHDIIYTHPLNSGAAIGRTAERDFLCFADAVSTLQDGVYLSVGSAVMSPMIFEKALSMAQNLALQQGRQLDGHTMVVVDLAPSAWDWQTAGEPPPDNPAYYLRYCKTFSRMGGTMRYLGVDNRLFLPALYRALQAKKGNQV